MRPSGSCQEGRTGSLLLRQSREIRTRRGAHRYPRSVARAVPRHDLEGRSSGSPTPSPRRRVSNICDGGAPSLGRGVGPPGACGVQDRAHRSGGRVTQSRSPDQRKEPTWPGRSVRSRLPRRRRRGQPSPSGQRRPRAANRPGSVTHPRRGCRLAAPGLADDWRARRWLSQLRRLSLPMLGFRDVVPGPPLSPAAARVRVPYASPRVLSKRFPLNHASQMCRRCRRSSSGASRPLEHTPAPRR
jgi:hypothetical protein